MDMKFSGKDTESTWRGYDFDTPASFAQTGSMGRPGVGRVREVDAEFPIGKRCINADQPGGYPQRKAFAQTAATTVVHRIGRGVYDYGLGGAEGGAEGGSVMQRSFKGGALQSLGASSGRPGGPDGIFTDAALHDSIKADAMSSVAQPGRTGLLGQGFHAPQSPRIGSRLGDSARGPPDLVGLPFAGVLPVPAALQQKLQLQQQQQQQ
jgi:hypothetical protein